MNYLIRNPRNYKSKYKAKYNYALSFDDYHFENCRFIMPESIDKPLVFDLNINQKEVLQFDNIINGIGCLVVNQKLEKILSLLIPNDLQFFDTQIKCKDGIITNYKLVNILKSVEGVDHEKSNYWNMVNIDEIGGFHRLVLKENCMQKNKLARLAEFPGHILATEEIKQAFEAEKVTGLRFVVPEAYYAELYPGYAARD